MIKHEQTAYVKDRFICKTGRLISGIIEVSDFFITDGFLVTGYWKGLWFIKSLFLLYLKNLVLVQVSLTGLRAFWINQNLV